MVGVHLIIEVLHAVPSSLWQAGEANAKIGLYIFFSEV